MWSVGEGGLGISFHLCIYLMRAFLRFLIAFF